MKSNKKKTKAQLKDVMQRINKTYGDEVIRTMSDTKAYDIDCISSGALTLDSALGGNGFPVGRIIEIIGMESSGKTTLALQLASEVQKNGGTVAYIDAEHALNPTWAETIGVNLKDIIINQPDCGEQGLDIVEKLVESEQVDLIIVDSVAALSPSAELSGEMGQSHIGLQARLMSQAMRKLTALLHKTSTTIVFINQIRMKVGVMFGNPEVTPGGNALKFYSSVRVDVRRMATLKDTSGNAYGIRVRARVIKNKVAAPFQVAEFNILFDSGIDTYGCLIDECLALGFIQKAGAWYSIEGVESKFQGKDAVVAYLKENDYKDKLIKLCKEA